MSRMWRAWLEAAYPYVETWASWTEVQMRRGIPDGLAWGHKNGQEILFWLEVEGGPSSRRIMERQYHRRLQLAMNHAYNQNIMVVFCLMGRPWVVKEFAWNLSGPYYFRRNNFAIIGHGRLPFWPDHRCGSGWDWHDPGGTDHCQGLAGDAEFENAGRAGS